MATRVLITLTPGASTDDVVEALTALGAASVQPPQPELPGVCIATVDEKQRPAAAWVTAAQQIPGVADAEVDRLRWSL